jgi:hypothetical protein
MENPNKTTLKSVVPEETANEILFQEWLENNEPG